MVHPCDGSAKSFSESTPRSKADYLARRRLSRQTCEHVIFVEERFGAFFKLRMYFNAIDRTDDLALRFVVVPHALGARTGVDHVNLCAHRDGIIGTLWFAHVAVDAFVGNTQRHLVNYPEVV